MYKVTDNFCIVDKYCNIFEMELRDITRWLN